MPRTTPRQPSRDEPISITVDRVTSESEAAIRVLVAGDQDFWIPRSLILTGSEVDTVGDDGLLLLPAWFVTKEEIPVD